MGGNVFSGIRNLFDFVFVFSLQCEEMINLLEVILKGRIQNSYSGLKDCLKAHIEKKRKDMLKQLSKN